MLLFLLFSAWMAGMPALSPLKVVGATLVGPDALPGVTALADGASLHLLLSAALGVLFVSLWPRDLPIPCMLAIGVGYAFFVLGLMTSIALPVVNPGFRGEMQQIGGSWVIAHALYGAALGGMATLLQRGLARAPRDRDAAPPRELERVHARV